METTLLLTLPHTGLQVPCDEWRVSSFKTTVGGSAPDRMVPGYAAALRFSDKRVGWAVNDGGSTKAKIPDHRAQAAFLAYVDCARLPGGALPTEEAVLEDLISEYEWQGIVARAEKRGHTPLRRMAVITGNGYVIPFAEITAEWSEPITGENMAEVATALAEDTPTGDRHGLGVEKTYWQHWTGAAWSDLIFTI